MKKTVSNLLVFLIVSAVVFSVFSCNTGKPAVTAPAGTEAHAEPVTETQALTDPSLYTFTELSDGTYEIKAKGNIPEEAVIPSTHNGKPVTSIGDYAFAACSELTSINYKGTKEQWDAVSKGSDRNYNTGNYAIHCSNGDIKK